ncbi:Dam family site-specific DNA-(adenine-N6)-methyltransferase [Anaerococcus sp. NML200574]|uniref:DNA adenine methylase n=1 Tax=Anaerococcus sp. NML200574 TaxID=2954486 RepID=UPI002237F32E|nr:Dam family site-specific DNA-(adenine-N6)-methyltransferase [Anaerococcus sp. NML200574]MCW6678497.1 Dam family site-specific DNA-(adenine-N6)-methyltransferase [Anaerococcus sp. NML200574]
MSEQEKDNFTKPFLKWAGGKSQLLHEIRKYYPFNDQINKYCEPFVGAGAVLFDILNNFDLKEIYISDINKEAINLYKVIRDDVEYLIELLDEFQKEYQDLNLEQRKIIYYRNREEFNLLKLSDNSNNLRKAALFMFLNKTGFNGLYRENMSGEFNVPIGSYKNPKILDRENLINVNKKLQNVKIIHGDYKKSEDFIDSKTFVYFDPPYRPIKPTSNFTAYNKGDFNDDDQRELAEFFKKMDQKSAHLLLSNSDPKNYSPDDNFFDDLYGQFNINRVAARRFINSDKNNRGFIYEILVNNFKEDKNEGFQQLAFNIH